MENVIHRRAGYALASAAAILLALYAAYASSAGRTGQTLKNSPTAGCGAKVTGGGSCHGTTASGAVTVTLSGPAVLPLGGIGSYTLSLAGTSGAGGGLDIAVSRGSLSSTNPSIQLLDSELTHAGAINTPYTIDFTFSAPDTGIVTMYANGKGASHSGSWNWAPNLSVRVGPPPAPVLVSPPSNSPGIPTSPTLSWRGLDGSSWTLEISTSPDFATTVLHRIVSTDTSFKVPPGTLLNSTQYYWHVSAKDTGGTGPWSSPAWSFTTSLTGVEILRSGMPSAYALSQNYPNPFNPSTQIRFSLPVTSAVRLVVYDVQGKEVAVLADGEYAAGLYTVPFNAGAFGPTGGAHASGVSSSTFAAGGAGPGGLSSGVYFYRLSAVSLGGTTEAGLNQTLSGEAGSFRAVRKLLLLR